jgi:holliday junction DNA helicase RuvA
MIDSLNGIVLEKGQDHAVVECHGVGYLVHIASSTAARLPESGACRFHIHYAVSVDVRSGSSEHRLFGFLHADERRLFRQLIEVQGVSATLGMAILGARSAEDVHRGILLGDEGLFKSVKGIGPKLAQRIVSELQGKLAQGAMPVSGSGHAGHVLPGNTLRAEALSALVSLGLDRAKAERSLQAVLQEHSAEPPGLEELIKLTLKNL